MLSAITVSVAVGIRVQLVTVDGIGTWEKARDIVIKALHGIADLG